MTGKSMHNRKFTESSTNFNSGGDNHGGSIIRQRAKIEAEML
jgi:hypothetical protein